MERKKKIKDIAIKIGLVVLVLMYIYCLAPVQLQNDTLFDIKVGEKYVTEGVTIEDDFSIHSGLNYVSHHFVPSILTYYVFENFGYMGLFILEILLTAILALAFYIANRLFLKSKKFAYMFVFLELFLMTSFISIRAQMYSYIILLFEIIFAELFLRGGKKRYIVGLTLFPLILVNFHAGVLPFYFIVLLVYLCNYIRIKLFKVDYEADYCKRLKYLLIPIVIGAGLTIINPFGLDGIIYGFKTINNSFINKYISEFQPFSIKTSEGIKMTCFMCITMLTLIFTNKKIKLYHLMLFGGTAFMALIAIRNFSLFVIFSVVILPYIEEIIENIKLMLFDDVSIKGQRLIQNVLIGVFTFVVIAFSANVMAHKPNVSLPSNLYPLQAAQYVKDNIGTDKRIFNEYFYGSTLMFKDIKVFIDSRCDLYTKEYNPSTNIAFDYINAINCYDDYNAILKKYDIEYLFINKSTSLAKNIINNSNYVKLYEDNLVYIFKVNF